MWKDQGRKRCKHLLRGSSSGSEKQYTSEACSDLSGDVNFFFWECSKYFQIVWEDFLCFMKLFQGSSIDTYHLECLLNFTVAQLMHSLTLVWMHLQVLCSIFAAKKAVIMPYSTKSWQHVSFFFYSTLFHSQRLNLQHLCTTHPIIYTKMMFQRKYAEKMQGKSSTSIMAPGDWAKPPDVANTWCKKHAILLGIL